ncbi:MAG: transcription-repair coupling factor [Bacteroidales bacterium]|nr:transcription-repair coupling factor [Bacteroidales bacterium]
MSEFYSNPGSYKVIKTVSAVAKRDETAVYLIKCADKKSALFFVSDLYNFFDEKCVYFLPSTSGDHSRNSIKSATEKVQRTSALEQLLKDINSKEDTNFSQFFDDCIPEPLESLLDKEKNSAYNPTIIVSYQEAIDTKVITRNKIKKNRINLIKGERISFDFLKEYLFEYNFKKVDFVGEPGEFALRGGIIDVFSFNDNNPYRIDFFGDEIESINQFDSNTQRTIKELDSIDIMPDLSENKDDTEMIPLMEAISPAVRFIDVDKCRQQENITPQPSFNKNFEIVYKDIYDKEMDGYKVSILSPNPNQTYRLQQILEEKGGDVHPDFIPISLNEGFIDHNSKRCYYTDHQIFERYYKITQKREVKRSERLTINELTNFNIGDYVVHINHGVGQFGGLVKKNVNGKIQEVIKIIYRDGDIVFVSIHGIHKISKYKSRDGEPPKIYKLGSKAWDNLKETTKKKVKDIAKDLIRLYSERQNTNGYAFSRDNYLLRELEASFMYEDTPDQHKAIESVKADMESIHPMDRLVCGDVGFGKTEVAVRAAFKAVCDGKQVAVLVPTTILALQHYQTFSARMSNLPCKIEYVSRLKTAKEIKQIELNVLSGKTDILIGTHKILGKSFEFKDLGLLIIDEEQKFGVSAKERLRQLKTSVDTLTLTATPIPRTLQFSLLGARDLSIINTPPPNRLPVYTEVIDFQDELIKEIIESEIERGGQVYFVHNRVDDIYGIEGKIRSLCPDARTCVAHGQMDAKLLENKIIEFIDGDYDVLISTTIIENGIDIPNANTMIIDSAHHFGLSDLHQLRGRVGRSNVKAYCYLIVPSVDVLSDDARRRLNAIETFSELGSGFNIAMQDLDIRGAGNLLGAEQSGFIADMGFETYQKILAEAMAEIQAELFCYPEEGRHPEGAQRPKDLPENTGTTNPKDSSHPLRMTSEPPRHPEAQPKDLPENTGTTNPKDSSHPLRMTSEPPRHSEGVARRISPNLPYVSDCQIETDMEALIPDSYLNVISEKIRLYKELDSMKDETQLADFAAEMQDRFGPIPKPLEELMNIVRLRTVAVKIAIDRIVLRDSKMYAYFVADQEHPFYESDTFTNILSVLQKDQKNYFLQEKNNKLSITCSGVRTIGDALRLLKNLC